MSELLDWRKKQKEEEPEHRTVVRLTTSFWSDDRGVHVKKDLTYLKRQCVGYNVWKEEIDAGIEVEDIVLGIHDIYSMDDGVYDVRFSAPTDFFTGEVEEVEYFLVKCDD